MNDLSRRQVFHAHSVQVANVLGSDAVVTKFGDVRDGESIWQRANLLEIFRFNAVIEQAVDWLDGQLGSDRFHAPVVLQFDAMVAQAVNFLDGELAVDRGK